MWREESKQVFNKDQRLILSIGTMIPYIRQALERHYGVIILNPFLNSIKVENENQEITKVSIPYNDTPENHALYSLCSSCYSVDTFGIIF